MKSYNCIAVFSPDRSRLLFCRRMKPPYQGLYNFVGGKVEPGETCDHAAYRELEEETGITPADIQLVHFMDLTYYYQDFKLELYTGVLREDIALREEVNPLEWLSISEEDFADAGRFAGEQNIAHIVNVALKLPFEQ